MESLLFFLIWAVAIFVMMRFGCGAHIMGRGQGAPGNGEAASAEPNETRIWQPPAKDTDPVCNHVVSTASAKPSVFEGNVYYFCSRDCREAFEAAPDIYLSDKLRSPPKRLERSHG